MKDFAKRLVAINKGGAKTTYDLVCSLSLNKDQQMQLLLNGSDGIIDTAFKMGTAQVLGVCCMAWSSFLLIMILQVHLCRVGLHHHNTNVCNVFK